MEEDVEIELLYKAHGQMLMEAAASEPCEDDESKRVVCIEGSAGGQEISAEQKPRSAVARKSYSGRKRRRKRLTRKKNCTARKEKGVYNDSSTDVEELLDTQILSYVVSGGSKSTQEAYDETDNSFDDSNQRECCMNEILGDESLFRERSLESVATLRIGNGSSKDSDDKRVLELISLQNMIDKREDLLEKIERKLKEELMENEDELRKVKEEMNATSYNKLSRLKEPNLGKSFFKKFGMPYFKDLFGFPAPPNDDVKRKLKNGELIMTAIPKLRYWRKSNKDKLQDAIQLTLITENCDRLVSETNKLKRKLRNVSDEQSEREVVDRITECQNQLKKTRNMSYMELVANENPERDYDWLKYSASDLKGIHSADECKRFWHLYLKPTINKSSWDRSEDEKLKKLAEEMNFQNWERVAQLLGTYRTAYQCLIHYRNRLCDKQEFSAGKWSKEEDEKLLNVIHSAKIGDFIPWTKVATYMGDRNHNQIYNRYVNSLNPKLVKGRFSAEEDLLVVSGVEVFGASYKEIASLMSNRTPNQIRERYERHLLPKTAKTGSFSLEEDELLLKLVDKYGEKNFVAVAEEMKTRTRTQVRQRYNCIMQLMRTKPGWTLSNVKRRSIHLVSKNLTTTQKKVARVRKEVERVEKAFHLTKLESDTFRIEKLKELRDKIFMKKFDLGKIKKQAFSDNSEINKQLIEFFKYQYMDNPVKSSTHHNTQDNIAYLNEILFLAKLFGHDLQLPTSEDEICNSHILSPSLKTFLVETLEQQADHAVCDSQYAAETSSTSVREPDNIDYVEPEVDNTLIMEDRWHDASVDVSNLNFSEFFKRTVFDYSMGMHTDIWDSKVNRCEISVPHDATATATAESPIDHKYFFPPNSVTALGYKSILLARIRLRRDANTLPEKQVKTESAIDYRSFNLFQESLLSLFYCPKVLSVTHINSTLLPPVSSRTSRSESMTNHKGIIHLLNNSNKNILDIVRKVAKPKMNGALQQKKMRRNILEHNKSHQRQLQQFKSGITYKRKMNIEHLVKEKNEKGTRSNTQAVVMSSLKQKGEYCDLKLKAKEFNNSSNIVRTIDYQNNDSLNNKDNAVFGSVPDTKVLRRTYCRTRLSSKRHAESDSCSEPVTKKSLFMNSGDAKATLIPSEGPDNSCLESHSTDATN